MIGDLRAEWIKVSSTRMSWVLAIVALALTALNIVPTLLIDQGIDPVKGNLIWGSLGSASVIALVLGIVAMTGEFRHMTITESFLTEPKRLRFVLSKGIVQGAVGLLVSVVCIAFGIGLAVALLATQNYAPIDWEQVVRVSAGTLLAFTLYAVLGVAVGSLLTNQAVALTGALVWVLLIEPLVVVFLSQIGRWLPGGAVASILESQEQLDVASQSSGAQLLPAWGGALLLLAYAAALVALALTLPTSLRRDIT